MNHWTLGNRRSDCRGLDEVLRIIESIPTVTCGGDQPLLLFELSYQCGRRGAIVEIGSMAGRSTIALAYAQKLKNGQKVHAVDCAPHKDLIANLDRAGVTSWVELLAGWSSKIARSWNQPVELLFVDGNHSFFGCRRDLRCWTPHVVEGGFVVLHDFGKDGYSGVHRAVWWELLSKPSMWTTVTDREVGSLYVLQRNCCPPPPNTGVPSRLREFLMLGETAQWIAGEWRALR